MADRIIDLQNVCFSYGRKKILDRFSLSVEVGERVCLFGPSGCGKTTVLRLLCGLIKPNTGSVSVAAEKLRPVFQEDRLLPFLTVTQNVALFAGEEPVNELIASVGLEEAADEYPARLSGGMARRAAIARALAGSGELYLLDEPFNGLDAANTEKTAELILRRTAGKTVVCVLHRKEDAERLGCRIVEMPPREKQ